MQIVSVGDNLHEVSNPFSEKNKRKHIEIFFSCFYRKTAFDISCKFPPLDNFFKCRQFAWKVECCFFFWEKIRNNELAERVVKVKQFHFFLKVEQIAQLQSFIEAEVEYHRQALDILQELGETIESR